MQLTDTSIIYDVLALLCSLFTKEEERRCAVKWQIASDDKIKENIEKCLR